MEQTVAGREGKKENDIFFTCSLIDYIARKTKNKRAYIVDCLGKAKISKIYELADVYHSDNIDRVSDDFIRECHIEAGKFDNVTDCRYTIPSHWDIGKVYKRLVLGIMREEKADVAEAIEKAYHSFVSDKIDDYNSSFYYENPEYILQAYLQGNLKDL